MLSFIDAALPGLPGRYAEVHILVLLTPWQVACETSQPPYLGLPQGLSGKESACSVGDPDSIPGPGRSPGEGHGNLLQYSCLEIPMDREAWQATVHGVSKSQTQRSS